MIYWIAADLVMVVHFLFALYVVLGGIAVWRWPRSAWLHVPAFTWGLLVVAKNWVCPLTPIEQNLRLAAGEQGYQGGFLAHYIEPILYPEGLPQDLRLFFAIGLIILNIALYWHAYYRRRRLTS